MMWLYILLIGMFIIGLFVFITRMRSGSIMDKADKMLQEDKPDKHRWGSVLSELDIIDTEASKQIASKMRARYKELTQHNI